MIDSSSLQGLSLEGKIAIVTGAGSGIGRATALALLNNAFALRMADRFAAL